MKTITLDLNKPNVFALELTKSYLSRIPTSDIGDYTKVFVAYYTMFYAELSKINTSDCNLDKISKEIIDKYSLDGQSH